MAETAARRMRKRLFLPIVIGLFIPFALAAYWGFFHEPRELLIKTHPLAIPGAADAGIAGLKIAIIADLHAGAPYIDEAKIRQVVEQTLETKPDIILLLGDYVIHNVVGGRPIPFATVASLLGALKAPLGVYAVLGNHDWWENPVSIASLLTKAGITVIDDRAMSIVRNGQRFFLVGLSDFYQGVHDVAYALRGMPAGHKALCITHTPDIFPVLPDACLLTLAGHTHGGQVRLPLLGTPIVPSAYGSRYAAGLIKEKGHFLFVATGIGTSIIPVRFGVPPEISVVTIADGG
jgi:predicted MPP superfamily phosphohydrolase